jgi:chromosome segregation ATPase
MSLADMMDNLEIVNSDDVAAQSALSATVQGATETVQQGQQEAQAPAPALGSNTESIDSGALERLLSEVQGTQTIVAPEQAAEEAAESGDADPAQDQPQKLSGYQKRVQTLVAREKAAREEAANQQAAYQQQLAQLQFQLQQQQAQFQKQQLDYQREQLAVLQRREAAAEEAQLSPEERARRRFLSEATEQAKQAIAPEIEQLRQTNTQLMAERQRMREAWDKKQRLDRLSQEAQQTLSQHVLSGFDKADAQALGGDFEELFMTYCAAYGQAPDAQSAAQFNQLLDKISHAKAKAVSRAATKVASSQQVVRTAPGVRTGPAQQQNNNGKVFPAYDKLRKAGFQNYVQWIAKGSPAIP